MLDHSLVQKSISIQWIQNEIGCEVYFLHHDQKTNGFVEYRNGGHLIYIIGHEKDMKLKTFLDILCHEAGHVLYNREQMKKGIPYEEIVQRTERKLAAFESLLRENWITDQEYERLYQVIEEEYQSNEYKDQIWMRLKEQLGDFGG